MIAYETRLGKIDISETYLSKLIGHEVTSCFGVVGMVPSGSRQKLFNRFSKTDRADTGICVTGDADSISVELHIVVTYGMNINAIAKSIVNSSFFLKLFILYTIFIRIAMKNNLLLFFNAI